MQKLVFIVALSIIGVVGCKTTSKPTEAKLLEDKEIVLLNKHIYEDSLAAKADTLLKNYTLVWEPTPVNGNYAVVFKHKTNAQLALVIRGSVLEFSRAGFENWIMQDFNIFNMKAWNYTDSVKKAYVAKGSFEGFENLQKLKDKKTNTSLEDFLVSNINNSTTCVISGHSLGGNLAQLYSSYLQKKLPNDKKNKINLVTFGATAAGNSFFVKDLEDKLPIGKRFEIENDIAPKFPKLEALGKISGILNLDSIPLLKNLNINGQNTKVSKALDLLSGVAKDLNIISEENNYSQSQKHNVLLKCDYKDTTNTNAVLGIFTKAYYYHTIDRYYELLYK
jgi:triacylglycerol lipase